MPDIIDYHNRIAAYDEKICQLSDSYEALGERYAEVERRVKQTTLLWCHANPELSKKLGMERAEMAAALTQEQKADYYEICYLRIKIKIAEKIIDATQSGLSGLQSLMRYSQL